MARPKKKAEKSENKGKELFDFLNGIYTDQTAEFFDSLSDIEKKRYRASRYMIHRFLSMNPHYTPIVNEIQKYTNVPDRAHYLFLSHMIPRGRQFSKYIKGEKDEKYEKWIIDIVCKHYLVSRTEAIQYIEILYKQDKDSLRQLLELYGADPKELKKAKL